MPGGMGFPPKPDARRPNRGLGNAAVQVRLPRSGRKGRTPAWPLPDQTEREGQLWRRVWRTPQAIAWEQLGWTDAVARYCRVLAEAELPGAYRRREGEDGEEHEVLVQRRVVEAARAEARQLEDRLGLSPQALLRLRWTIVEDEGQEAPVDAPVDVRQRLRAM